MPPMQKSQTIPETENVRGHKLEALRQMELEKALAQIRTGGDPEQVLQRMSRSLMNKVMHAPTTQLRQAAENGRNDQIEWAQKLLGITEPTKPD